MVQTSVKAAACCVVLRKELSNGTQGPSVSERQPAPPGDLEREDADESARPALEVADGALGDAGGLAHLVQRKASLSPRITVSVAWSTSFLVEACRGPSWTVAHTEEKSV